MKFVGTIFLFVRRYSFFISGRSSTRRKAARSTKLGAKPRDSGSLLKGVIMTNATSVSPATLNATAYKLADMFTENTGRSMLDSGGAYGRAWERNAGMTAGDFLARPAVTVDADGDITVDMFNFLNERLTYAPDMNAAWVDFDAERPNLSWSESLNEWLDSLGVPSEDDEGFYSNARWDFNTYNFDSYLNGTFQGVKFVLNDVEYLALQVHGGCDVRGGYTAPVIFTGDMESVVLDVDRATLRCPESECDFYATFCGGRMEDTYLGDSLANPNMLIEVDVPTSMPETWEPQHGCPLHKVPLI
jgi:hypothetical protein